MQIAKFQRNFPNILLNNINTPILMGILFQKSRLQAYSQSRVLPKIKNKT